jgi:hypothetical protein
MIPAPRRLRQEDFKFQASLGYTVRPSKTKQKPSCSSQSAIIAPWHMHWLGILRFFLHILNLHKLPFPTSISHLNHLVITVALGAFHTPTPTPNKIGLVCQLW